MAANRIQLQNALHKPYDRGLFSLEVLRPVFGSGFTLNSSLVPASVSPNKSESAAIDKVWVYGNIQLDDSTEITCYEVLLQPKVRIEQSKVAIQQYVRKLLTAGQAAFINFIAPANNNVWRLTYVAKDSVLTEQGIKEKITHKKRYTFLLGPAETCKTAAERFEVLSTEKVIDFKALEKAFSVEKLSKAFFDEYTLHYQNFCNYLQESNYRRSVFNISIPADASKEEKDKACKPIRDFVKKLLGRIVFLYFVQKKGWLGASDTNYTDGLGDFIKQLFHTSGGNDIFYCNWLTKLFFDTLNADEVKRPNEDFEMPDGKLVKVPFLNGGLFDKEKIDESLLTFPAKLFHNPDFDDTLLTPKNNGYARGFLDFLDAFNFTVYEDSPDDHTVAVDPEMLGHIFENLLEDNKDKGAFYTPKEIVHYMCQESLIEYLATGLQKEYTIYKHLGNDQIELFGNESRYGQLKIMEELGEKGLDSDEVAYMVKHKDISKLTPKQLHSIDKLIDAVKICDPAIGSGAFPMGLLQEIFSIKELIAYETGKEWKPAETKLNIIQNSIYGVDIEKGAVDIARLRFWLSLVVDEEKPKALPNLDYKIVVGDSLISKFDGEIVEIDWERKQSVGKADEYVKNVQRLLEEVADKQKKYFNPNNKNKKKLQAEIRTLKIELLINQLSFNKELYINKTEQKGGFMPTAADIKHNTERELQIKGFDNLINKLKNLLQHPDEPFNHFDWKLDFPEVLNPYLVPDENQRGFDIVIGNPPYVSAVTMSRDEKTKKYYKEKYPLAIGSYDLYLLFLLKAIQLTSRKGIYTWIIPNKFLIAEYAKKAKSELIENNGLRYSINVSTFNVFEGVGIYPIIIFGNRIKQNEFKELLIDDYIHLSQRLFVIPKQLKVHKTFKNYGIEINSGATGFQAQQLKNIISNILKNGSIPFAVSGNINRYTWSNKSVRYMGNNYDTAFINNSTKVVSDSKWKFWNEPKIVIAGMTKVIEAVYIEEPLGIGVGIYGIYDFGKFEPYCLTAILNSKYLTHYFQIKFKDKHLAGGYLAINKSTIQEFPLVDIAPKTQKTLTNLSKKLHKSDFVEDPNLKCENEIDNLVYRLYDLSYDEVKVIDPEFPLSKEAYESIPLE